MNGNRVLTAIVSIQLLLGIRVLVRFFISASGSRIRVATDPPAAGEPVAVVVPVLNEIDRLAPCLDGLLAHGAEVGEVLVVDGGSSDATPDLVRRYSVRDPRIRLIDARPVPAGWNGKAWGLQVGLQQACQDSSWILTMDADVRPASLLVRSLLAHAHQHELAALSVATRQEIGGQGDGLIHPAMLTTLVYRFGLPGNASRRASRIQANGQCFLVRREVLARTNAIRVSRASRCEDVTIGRCLATAGWEVGFYEAGDLVWTQMYPNWRETWRNWPRSLPLRDQYCRGASIVGLLEVAFVQALPLPLLLMLIRLSRRSRRWMLITNVVLAIARVGVLGGTARAYRRIPWTYWLSPLCDLPVVLRIWASALQRRHVWRGRVLVTGGIR